MKRPKLKTIVLLSLLVLVLYGLPRQSLITKPIERELLRELRDATAMDFSIERVSLNLLPLYAQAEGVIGKQQGSNLEIDIKKVKAYIGIVGLMNRELSVNRLIIREFQLGGNREGLERLTENLKAYLSIEIDKPVKVVVKSIEIESGQFSITDGNDRVSVDSINAFIKPSGDLSARVFLGDINLQTDLIKDLTANLTAHLSMHDDRLNLSNVSINFLKSRIKTTGNIDRKTLMGPVEIQAKVLWETLKRVFGLKNDDSGWIESSGRVNINANKPLFEALDLDLQIKGEFFLETLMELLKVRKPLRGFVGVSGSIKGPLKDLEGSGEASLEAGNIFDVPIDRLHCKVHYKDRAMRFTDGKASLYSGKADVNVMIALPVVNYFEVDVRVEDISSRGIFSLIKWDPGIAEGRVNGNLSSKGREFSPSGMFTYRSDKRGGDILNRIREINSRYSLNSEILTLTDLSLHSLSSVISANGKVDLKNGLLDLSGRGYSSEIRELTTPYFTALSGETGFDLLLKGELKDPVIDMRFRSPIVNLDTGALSQSNLLTHSSLKIKEAKGDILYRKDLLTIRGLDLETDFGRFNLRGDIHFLESKGFFDLRSPIYDLRLYVQGGDIKSISALFKGSPKMGGELTGQLTIEGPTNGIEGRASFITKGFSIDDYQIGDTLKTSVFYKGGTYNFTDAVVSIGNEQIRGKGSLSINNKAFTLKAEAKALTLGNLYRDIPKPLSSLSLSDITINGHGSLDKPYIEATSRLMLSGNGHRHTIRGEGWLLLDQKRVSIRSELLDNKILLQGDVSLEDKTPWRLSVDLKTARYDFLLSNFFKELPENLVLNLNGHLEAWGNRDEVNGTALFDKAYLYLYGNGLSNKGNIRLSVHKNTLSLNNLVLFNDNAEFKASGNLRFGKRYDLLFEGRSSLTPFRVFFRSLDALKGDANFVVSVSGDWNEPRINGGVDVSNGSIGLKGIYYRATSVSAYIYFDEDRLIIANASGKIAGGLVTLKGNARIKRFNIERFFLETHINNATLSPSKDLWINFGGNLYARGDLNTQQIVGEIRVNKGRYTERIDWKNWLIGASKIERPRAQSDKFERVSINVKIVGDNLQVDNNLSRSTLSTDLILRGTLNNPIPIGKVEIREGTVFFRNNEFRIIKANLDLANPEQIRPYFNIVADTRVQNYNIRLMLEGFTEQFNLSLSSDPYLPETDIFALLTVGQTGKKIKGMEAGIGAGEAAAFLTGKIQDLFEERAKSITGFDRVQIDPAISKTTSAVSPRITVSKRLLADRLYVTYSASIASGEEQVLKLEYMLTPNTSIVGIRDERGGIGADLKFRFSFR